MANNGDHYSKIYETLNELKVEVASIGQKVEQIAKSTERLDKILRGNGQSPGVTTRLDRLEISEANRKWQGRATYGALIGLVCMVAKELFYN